MLVPPPAQMGAASDLQPYSAAGPEQSQACPASPIPFPFPLGFEGIDGEGLLITPTSHSPLDEP